MLTVHHLSVAERPAYRPPAEKADAQSQAPMA